MNDGFDTWPDGHRGGHVAGVDGAMLITLYQVKDVPSSLSVVPRAHERVDAVDHLLLRRRRRYPGSSAP